MELLDNDYVDEQSGEGLVLQHFDKLVFWQRLVGVLLILGSSFFWWMILRDPYIRGEQYKVFFSLGTVLTLTGITTLVFSLKQTKETKETTPNTVQNLFRQQSYLWTVFIGAALFFVILVGFYLTKMVEREWSYAVEKPVEELIKPPPPQQLEEIEELIEEVLIEDQE